MLQIVWIHVTLKKQNYDSDRTVNEIYVAIRNT
jgi:hypothetical protein